MALRWQCLCRWSWRTQRPCLRSLHNEASRKRSAMLGRFLRVDQAGEIGAVQIYKGQLAVLGKSAVGPTINEMLEQEKNHVSTFEGLMPKYGARPSILCPLWNVAGYALGVGTALLGKEAAMACTVAVETAIGEHYNNQLRELMADGESGKETHKELIQVISKFRDEELVHLETGLEHNAEKAPMYNVLNQAIQAGCKTAIWLANRI